MRLSIFGWSRGTGLKGVSPVLVVNTVFNGQGSHNAPIRGGSKGEPGLMPKKPLLGCNSITVRKDRKGVP